MPGPWLSASADPEAWQSFVLHEGDYVEFVTYDSGRVKQGTVLARLDAISEKTSHGMWTEVTFLAVSDEHLSWWLTEGGGKDDHWQFELHFCKGSERSCKQTRRGRSHDFHTDKFRMVPIGDLSDKKIEWIKKSKHKKYVEEEIQRMAGQLPTGKEASGSKAAQGLDFEEAKGLPAAEPSLADEALKGLSKLEAELDTPRARKKKKDAGEGAGPLKRETSQEERKKKKKKRRKEDETAHGRAQSAPAGGQWFGAPVEADPADGSSTDTSPPTSTSGRDKRKKKKKKRKEESRDRARSARDRGPFGTGRKVSYGGVVVESGSSSEDPDFRNGPP